MKKNNLNHALVLIIFLLIIGSLNLATAADKAQKSTDLTKFKSARIKTQKGEIVWNFLPKKAPQTVKRIKELIHSGFYNGITFHRVIPGFVAQAGDPTATGSGGSGQNIKAEFNDEKHAPGIVAMARKGNDINSADSQFYITLGTPSHLDGQYTIFAKVTEGMKVANRLMQEDKILWIKLE